MDDLGINLGGLFTPAEASSGNQFDMAIIGGGPAGLSAALYAARSRQKVVVFEKMALGGTITITEWVENYPGFPEGISGYELAQKMEEQARKFGADIKSEEVISFEKNDQWFIVKSDTQSYQVKSIILTMGTSLRKLDVPGEKEFTGRGVSYCATCDAAFFRNKIVTVIGGGDSAVEEGLYLTRFADKVYIVHRRDQLRAAQIIQERALKNEKVEFIWNSVVEEVLGEKKVTALRLRNVKTQEISEHRTDGVFVFVGQIPNSELARSGGVETDNRGFILTDNELCTNVPGVFAAGDIRSKSLLQIVTAVGEGAQAEFSAEKYMETLF